MNLAPKGQSGLALGAWGAVQASAAGVAIALGGVIRDTFAGLASGTAFGAAGGYDIVYAIEIVLASRHAGSDVPADPAGSQACARAVQRGNTPQTRRRPAKHEQGTMAHAISRIYATKADADAAIEDLEETRLPAQRRSSSSIPRPVRSPRSPPTAVGRGRDRRQDREGLHPQARRQGVRGACGEGRCLRDGLCGVRLRPQGDGPSRSPSSRRMRHCAAVPSTARGTTRPRRFLRRCVAAPVLGPAPCSSSWACRPFSSPTVRCSATA